MARIFPFRALRYNPSLVRVEDCVTQPYDKITPSMQQAYYARSPYNLVRIILGLPELFDEPGTNDVYTRAAEELEKWRLEGVLAQEQEPCLFAYAQRFTAPGSEVVRERRGLIALGALSPYCEGIVFRHEQTHTRARTDRMSLLTATRAHFGQIFMLYSDPAQTVESLIFSSADGTVPDIEVTDDLGVLHRVWKVNDPATINMVQGVLGDKKLIIADGHHRYETALAYSEAHAPAEKSLGNAQEPPFPEAAVMMTLVNMDGTSEGEEQSLVILPTHRIADNLPSFDGDAFLQQLQALGAVVTQLYQGLTVGAPGPSQDALLAALGSAARVHAAAFVVLLRERIGSRAVLVTFDEAARATALPQLPERRRQLDMVLLHEGIFAPLLQIDPADVQAGKYVRYNREAAEAISAVQNGEAQLAFLVRPVTLDQLRENTFAGEVMPQKSTDFYPKLLSGLTIYALDEYSPGIQPSAKEQG
jgi:uncharacterized protein (DUF1015 family)